MNQPLRLDPDSDRPPYEQLRMRIIELIGSGDLLVGQRLPTVRSLATDIGLAPNTVARTYRELEAAGFIETRGRQGSFVRAGADAALDAAQRATVEHVKTLRELGMGDDQIVSLVQQVTQET